MRIKTYVFEDIKDGMDRIKEDHGPDTVILDIKYNNKNPARKSCEISIGLEDETGLAEEDYGAVRKKTEEIWNRTAKILNERIAMLESEITGDRLRQYPLPLKVFFEKMKRNGLDMNLAVSIISEVYGDIGMLANDIIKANFFFKKVIAKKIKIYDIVNSDDHVLILGPSGAGKTQTAKKLLKILSAMEKEVSLVVYDPVRKLHSDEHVTFPEIYNVPVVFAVNEEDINAKIARDRTRKIIDVSGYIDTQKRIGLKLKNVKKIILLPAGARDEKIRNYCDRFSDSNIAGLIFTKLDEEGTLGHICRNLILLEQAVCCLTTGMDIDDVLIPSHEVFYKILLEGNVWKRGEKRLSQ